MLSNLQTIIETLVNSKDKIDECLADCIDKNPRYIYAHKPHILRALYDKVYNHFPELLVQSSKLITVQFGVKNAQHKMQSIYMLIDTGAAQGLVKYNACMKLGLMDFIDTGHRGISSGIGGAQETYGQIPYLELQYKDCALPAALCVQDIVPDPLIFDGILGIDWLCMYNVVIDLPNRQLVVNGHLKIPIQISN